MKYRESLHKRSYLRMDYKNDARCVGKCVYVCVCRTYGGTIAFTIGVGDILCTYVRRPRRGWTRRNPVLWSCNAIKLHTTSKLRNSTEAHKATLIPTFASLQTFYRFHKIISKPVTCPVASSNQHNSGWWGEGEMEGWVVFEGGVSPGACLIASANFCGSTRGISETDDRTNFVEIHNRWIVDMINTSRLTRCFRPSRWPMLMDEKHSSVKAVCFYRIAEKVLLFLSPRLFLRPFFSVFLFMT